MVAKVFSMLDMQKDKDIPLQSRKNCITILGTDPALCGKIKFNTLSNRKNVEGALPWNKSEKLREWKEIDNHYLLYYFETYYFINAEKKIFSALEMMADTNKFNPFIDMLNSVKWDGVPRVDSLLTDYLGVKKNEYSSECLRLLMLAAVSRAFSPGTKFDYVLVLQGKQGIGKSTFFMKLCCNDEWYLENLKNIDKGKDSAELIQGKIIVEFGEMLAMRGKTEEIKAFVTLKSDEYREPYARETEKRYRTCVFVGTTNEAQFLTDKTGNRRFLPLHCGAVPITKSLFVDEEELKAEFMQAWAEIYQIYLSGKFNLVIPANLKCYVDEALEDCMEDDPMVGLIQGWLDQCGQDYVCNLMIASEVFGVDEPDRRMMNRITDIMNNVVTGWERSGTHRFGGKIGKQKCYAKLKPPDGFIQINTDDVEWDLPFE